MDRIKDTSSYELSTSQDGALFEEDVISFDEEESSSEYSLVDTFIDKSLVDPHGPDAALEHNPSPAQSLSSNEDDYSTSEPETTSSNYDDYSEDTETAEKTSASSEDPSSDPKSSSDLRSHSPVDLFDTETEPFLEGLFATEVSKEPQISISQYKFSFYGRTASYFERVCRTGLAYADEQDPYYAEFSDSESSNEFN